MARITRKAQKVLGLNSVQTGQFGSARASTFVLTKDPDVIQALPAFEQGWPAATVSGDNLPTMEETEGVDFLVTRQLAYIFQEGIPEYNATTEYHEDSIVKESGTVKLYKSLTNTNTGNPLSDPTKWALSIDLDNSGYHLNNYTATTDPTVNDDSADGYTPGSIWYNTTGTGEAFLCTNNTAGAAKWIKTTLTADELGSAAFTASSAYATAAQGAKADTAIQPNTQKIRQCEQLVDTTNRSTSSPTYVTSSISFALSQNLASTSSKVKIDLDALIGLSSGSGVGQFAIYRNGVDITPAGVGCVSACANGTGGLNGFPGSFSFIDSPGVTTSPTYAIYWKVNTGILYFGRRHDDTAIDAPTMLTLTEIV